MSGYEGLGKAFNIIPTGSGAYVNCSQAAGVSFVCVGNDTFTLLSSATASGGSALNVIDHFFTNTSAVGAAAWVRNPLTGVNSATNAIVSTSAALVFWVNTQAMPDGHKYLKVTASASGLVYAVTHDLEVQRKASNLPALGV